MKIRNLTTADEVIDAIGGLRLQLLTEKKSNNISNWRADGRLPGATYLICQAELKRLHCRAPASLWGIVEPRKEQLKRAG